MRKKAFISLALMVLVGIFGLFLAGCGSSVEEL